MELAWFWRNPNYALLVEYQQKLRQQEQSHVWELSRILTYSQELGMETFYRASFWKWLVSNGPPCIGATLLMASLPSSANDSAELDSSSESSWCLVSSLVSDHGSPLPVHWHHCQSHLQDRPNLILEFSPYPNRHLSGHGLRSSERLLEMSGSVWLNSLGSSGKESVFFFRSFLLSCLRAYEGLLLFPIP